MNNVLAKLTFHFRSRRCTHCTALGGRKSKQAFNRSDERIDAARLAKEARYLIVDRFAATWRVGRDDRNAHRRSFEQDPRDAFTIIRRQDHAIGLSEGLANVIGSAKEAYDALGFPLAKLRFGDRL